MTSSLLSIADLAGVAGDQTIPADRRLDAARQCGWRLEQEGVEEPNATLVRAVISRSVDDLKEKPPAGQKYEHFEFWRHFPTTADVRLDEPAQLRSAVAAVAGQMLFEASRHEDAILFFRRALEGTPTASSVILASYNLEVLARRSRRLDLVEEAIGYLTSTFAPLVNTVHYSAEVHHLLGHLLILKGRFTHGRTLGFERQGVRHLAQAVTLDPSYTSCYTFSFAEYGDFLTSIDTCLKFMRTKPYRDLGDRDVKLIDLELLFYLGYAYMAVGELERARACLETFMRSAEDMGSQEARDHARLFLVKLELKRHSLESLKASDLARAYSELRSLSFKHAQSVQMQDECLRHEAIVEFLIALTHERGGKDLDELTLATLEKDAREIVDRLILASPDLLFGVRIGVGPSDGRSRQTQAILDKVKSNIGAVAGIQFVDLRAVQMIEKQWPRPDCTFVLWRTTAREMLSASGVSDRILLVSDTKPPHVDVTTTKVAISILWIGLATVAIRRFWNKDQYVFGIVPCMESPTAKFQHPRLSVEVLL